MSNELNIPEVINLTIGEDIVAVPTKDQQELQTLITSIMANSAKVERDKLYRNIEELKDKVEQQNAQLQAYKGQSIPTGTTPNPVPSNGQQSKNGLDDVYMTKLREQLNEIRNKLDEKNSSSIEDMQANMLKVFEKNLQPLIQDQIKNAMNPIIEKTDSLNKEAVTAYMQKRIAEEGDTIIPEIIAGNTKEEIEASIIKSKEIRAKYPKTGVIEVPNPPNPQPRRVVPGEPEPVNIKKMSMEEFAKKREEIAHQLKQESNT